MSQIYRRLGAAGAALAFAALWPVAASETSLQPASPWTIEPSRYACFLSRQFGEGDAAVDLQLRRQVTMGALGWALRFAHRVKSVSQLELQLEKFPQQEKVKLSAVRRSLADRGQSYLLWSGVSAEESFTDDQILRLSAKGDLRWQLQTSGMGQAVAALDNCVSDPRKSLGFNDNVSVKPEPVMEPSPGTWATNDDYPPQSRRNRDEGIVHFLLMVSETGAVKDCHILESSGFAELDTKTCELMRQRAKFDPAKDANGAAVASQYTNRLLWKLPN